MSRPSVVESRELERLESVAGSLAQVLASAGVLAVRMRQIARRAWGEQDLVAVVRPAFAELSAIADRADEAHQVVSVMLEERQRERTANNRRCD